MAERRSDGRRRSSAGTAAPPAAAPPQDSVSKRVASWIADRRPPRGSKRQAVANDAGGMLRKPAAERPRKPPRPPPGPGRPISSRDCGTLPFFARLFQASCLMLVLFVRDRCLQPRRAPSHAGNYCRLTSIGRGIASKPGHSAVPGEQSGRRSGMPRRPVERSARSIRSAVGNVGE